MSSNGPPPKDYPEVPTSPPAPSPSVKRRVVDGTECSKADVMNTWVACAMLGMTTDFSMLGLLDSQKSEDL
jgi:hypothetical protein